MALRSVPCIWPKATQELSRPQAHIAAGTTTPATQAHLSSQRLSQRVAAVLACPLVCFPLESIPLESIPLESNNTRTFLHVAAGQHCRWTTILPLDNAAIKSRGRQRAGRAECMGSAVQEPAREASRRQLCSASDAADTSLQKQRSRNTSQTAQVQRTGNLFHGRDPSVGKRV